MVRHPAPLPFTPPQQTKPGEKKIPPQPIVKVNKCSAGIIVTWTIEQLTAEHADIQTYHIYAYEETIASPSSDNWKFIEEVLPLLLPMGATLTQFQGGKKFVGSLLRSLKSSCRSKIFLRSPSSRHLQATGPIQFSSNVVRGSVITCRKEQQIEFLRSSCHLRSHFFFLS